MFTYLMTSFFLVLTSSQALAKIATVGDLPYVFESDQFEITVQADGRSRVVRDSMIRVINDQGREAESVQTLQFNSRAQTFKILDAATLNGKVRTPVPKQDIEVKEVGEMSQAFDSIKQVGISYPRVQVGSKLHLRYEMKMNEVPIKGFWSVGYSFEGANYEKFSLHIHSKLPLNYSVRDSKNRFAHSLTPKAGGWIDLEVHATSPILTVVTQEENPFMMPEHVPAISVSSLPDWTRYGSSLIPAHEKILSASLPAPLAEIAKKASLEKTTLDKVQSVAAGVAQEFRYFGDWRRRDGGFIPRSLDQIANSRYGDCKDLSMVVTAIYRSLGYKANLAWVFRGDIAPAEEAYKLPVDSLFNHAITRLEADGKVYWIDATNPVAYARGVYTDIADRPAFVLYNGAGRLERTPALRADEAVFSSHLVYELQSDESLVASATVMLGGRAAIPLTARAFYAPVEAVNYDIIHSLANSGKVSDAIVGDFERGSRVVQDLTIPAKFKLAETGLRTSAGLGYPLFRDDSVGRILVETKERVSDIDLGAPNTDTTVIDLVNVRLVGQTSLDCNLTNEYVNLSRAVKAVSKGLTVTDKVVIKKQFLPAPYLQSDEFSKFQTAARNCFNRAAVVFEKR